MSETLYDEYVLALSEQHADLLRRAHAKFQSNNGSETDFSSE
jgi:hypothetical protein